MKRIYTIISILAIFTILLTGCTVGTQGGDKTEITNPTSHSSPPMMIFKNMEEYHRFETAVEQGEESYTAFKKKEMEAWGKSIDNSINNIKTEDESTEAAMFIPAKLSTYEEAKVFLQNMNTLYVPILNGKEVYGLTAYLTDAKTVLFTHIDPPGNTSERIIFRLLDQSKSFKSRKDDIYKVVEEKANTDKSVKLEELKKQYEEAFTPLFIKEAEGITVYESWHPNGAAQKGEFIFSIDNNNVFMDALAYDFPDKTAAQKALQEFEWKTLGELAAEYPQTASTTTKPWQPGDPTGY